MQSLSEAIYSDTIINTLKWNVQAWVPDVVHACMCEAVSVCICVCVRPTIDRI